MANLHNTHMTVRLAFNSVAVMMSEWKIVFSFVNWDGVIKGERTSLFSYYKELLNINID